MSQPISHQSIWLCIDSLATLLDGGREASEGMIDELENDLKQFPKNDREEMRRKIIVIVASLARLEVRLVGADGGW